MEDIGQKPESAGEAEKRNTPAAFSIAAAFIGVIFFLIVGMAIYPDGEHAWGYGINLFTSIVSTIATVGIIEAFSRQREKREAVEREEANRRRDERNAVLARQQQLIDDAASNVNDVANNAVYQIRRRGWLIGEDGLLKGADLVRANLQGAVLDEANLQGARLHQAKLQGADLYRANLQRADLRQAHLQGADLMHAKLQKAVLRWAQLHGTDLSGAQLQGADLREADLEGADLEGEYFDEETKLPDGTLWTEDTDMWRFTDPEYPNFWRSDNLLSPAYRGKSEA